MIHLGMAEEAPLHVAEPSANKGGHDQQRDHPEGQDILINERAGQKQIADLLPERLAVVVTPAALETLRQSLLKISLTARPRLGLQDLISAVCVFALVVLATFPIVIPFIFIPEAVLALRISNWVAVALLFICGVVLGRHAGGNWFIYGTSFAIIGAVLVNAIIALGG